MRGDRLWRYALTQPGRDPLYLPGSTKPQRIGYPRNIALDQPPGSESSFTLGDGMRRVAPLILTGTITPDDLQTQTESAWRIYLREFDTYARAATGIQRDSSVTRTLHPGTGWVEFDPQGTLTVMPFTLTLMPTGPAWLDSDGLPVPM